MSEMIERVAQPIRTASGGIDDETFWTTPNPEADRYRELARAAIAAMRDPTSTMELAAEDVAMSGDDGALECAPFTLQWQAAIDTALLSPAKQR